MTGRDKIRAISFWSLMVFLALVLAKMNTVADFFVKMNLAGQDDKMNWLLNFIPLALVVVLFLFICGIELGQKSREKAKS
jgi:uncharacterized membrane protein